MLSALIRSLKGRLPLGVLGPLVTCGLLASQFVSCKGQAGRGMFVDRSYLLDAVDTNQLNYGVAVSDVDGDGEMEWIVAGFSGPNLVLKLDRATGRYYNLAVENDDRFSALRDEQGQAIGVCACDIDGDGREEIYFLNTNDRYSGPKLYKDKLFKWRRGADGRERYEDLFADSGNDAALSMFAGRSVAAVDRTGRGKYSVILATYAQGGQGSFGLIEMDEGASDVASGRIVLKNVAQQVGIAMATGGRGITVGPIVGTNGHSDIFFDNEGGYGGNDPRNALFANDGNGRYTNVAQSKGLADRSPGRGVALADFNNDGRIDIVYGNWMDPHKLMMQQPDGTFQDRASREMAEASPVRTVIAADFDNDGDLEVFFNNIVYRSRWGGDSDPELWKNRVFRVTPASSGEVSIAKLDVGDAVEPDSHGTGGAVADMDNDGQLELLLSHGESRAQPISLFHVREGRGQGWIRVMPLTRYNAPARGARVTVVLEDGRRLTRVIDGGSGYLCQMEPVAHVGLGRATARSLSVQWPDGCQHDQPLSRGDQGRLHRIPYPRGRCSTSSSARGSGRSDGRGSQEPDYQLGGTSGGQRRTSGRGSGSDTSRGSSTSDRTVTSFNRRRRPTTSADSCSTARVRKYLRDDATGCYSARPIRIQECQGTCSAGGRCCRPRAERYRNVLFACRNGARFTRVAKAGVRRCRCVRCPAA